MKHHLFLPLALLLSACAPRSNSDAPPNPLSGFEMREGVFNIHVNKKTNQIYARLPGDWIAVGVRAGVLSPSAAWVIK